MKIFTCSACQHVAFFENVACIRCGHALAYLPDLGILSALEQVPESSGSSASSLYVALSPDAQGARYRLCENYAHSAVCNWALQEHDPNDYCRACRLTTTVPNLSDADAVDSWRRLEIAKRRLVYTLIELGLPFESKDDQPETGLTFAFKQDSPDGERVLTGHCAGLVTINIREADAPSREQMRVQLGERYRTLLGHFRHESGHYYWDRLIKDSSWLQDYRSLFGDESSDYQAALKQHYSSPRQNWADEFVSAYASMHPWEDWAETWAHYLHMVDTLETARSYGLVIEPKAVGGAASEAVTARRVHFDDFEDLIAAWVPLTVALNSLNRSMGLPDIYPFVLAERAIEKLRFVHQVIERASTGLDAALIAPKRSTAAEASGPEIIVNIAEDGPRTDEQAALSGQLVNPA
jgi:hypothetical protein